MSLTVVTAPEFQPVTLEQAEQHLRVDIDEDDGYIASLIQVAREHVENFTRRALVTQSLKLVLDDFPGGDEIIELQRPPVASITSIAYTDIDGDPQTVDSADYRLDSASEPARLEPAYGTTWPSARPMIGSVEITYVAGWSSPELVPAVFRQAMLLLIGHWYENREQVVIGPAPQQLPFAVRSLLWPRRVLTF